MRRSFPATAGGTPTASSSWMSRRSPLWATFLIFTTDAILCRCIASSDTFRKACWATLLGRLPLSGPEPDGRSAPLSPSSWSRRSTRCAGGGAAGRSRRPARSAGGSLRGLRACAGPDLVHGVGRRADWTPLGALTSCFLWTHRGQHRALNNRLGVAPRPGRMLHRVSGKKVVEAVETYSWSDCTVPLVENDVHEPVSRHGH